MSVQNQKGEAPVLNDVEHGKYRDCYLIYNRRSTDDPDLQKNSIKYQKSENVRFAFREHLRIPPLTLEGFATDGIVSERHSAFKEDLALSFDGGMVRYRVERPKFYQLVQLLSKGYFKGVIFLCWDRASRNKGDDTILRKLMKAGVDIRFSFAQYDKSSSGALHMDIDGMFAEHHSRVTSEKVTLAKRTLRDQGVCTFRAPVGYLNNGDMYRKPFDPERAPIVRQMFEKAANDGWSLADLARWAIDQGFTMRPQRRPRTQEEILAEEDDDVRLEIEPISRVPTYNTVHKILTNPFYAGKIEGPDGVWLRSTSHEALVSGALFDRVQDRLRSHRMSAHYATFIDYPFRRFIYCAVCGRAYTPYLKKGILYYGARCSANCTNRLRGVNFTYITGKVEELLGRLSFSNEERAEIDARAGTDLAVLETKRLEQLEINGRRKGKIRGDLAYLNANRLTLLRTGAYSAEALVSEETRLNHELESLKDDENISDIAIRETVKDVERLSELVESAAVIYHLAEPQEKDRIARIIFSELTLSENILDYKCKNGFQALANRFLPNHDPMRWISELLNQRGRIEMSIRELKQVASRDDEMALAA